ncbi:MAG TPA: methyltransferase domain-containing protein [Actinomycetota bacterium]|nr:methyltransferase domain-containing protein [Actinomycetota bacterium]
MPSTGSDGRHWERPKLNFSWESPYGHVVSLVSQLGLKEGVVLDLGCGYGAVAEPLAELGLEYLGLDSDKKALDDLRHRGFQCFDVDLSSFDDLRERVLQVVQREDGKPIRALLLLDVIEHFSPASTFLGSLKEIAELAGNPLLLVSVPNVAHVDVGAKLALGRFDYTPTGLLDETHVSFFTESRLRHELAAYGWLEVARNDFRLNRSDQSFPGLHPGVAPGASLSNFIRHWRNQVDGTATVNQFVRAFATTEVGTPEMVDPSARAFMSVIMRTEGTREDNLREALTCLAAQTCDDFTVKLLVHTANDELVDAVRAMVAEFDDRFAARCLVMQIVGGQRACPLNRGLELVDSSYVAFLDDDDLVTVNWVETFREGARTAMGKVIRSVTVDQQVHRNPDPNGLAPYVVHTGMHPQHSETFDMVQHFYANQTPICSFAVPAEVIDCFGLRFDEGLPVTEDWEFLLRACQVAGVHDTREVTSIYRRWVAGEGSSHKVDQKVWDGTRTGILYRFDQAPLLLPAGSATRISNLYESTLRLEQARLDAWDVARERMEVIEELREEIRGIQSSLSWKVTFPVRWFLHYARRISRFAQGQRDV